VLKNGFIHGKTNGPQQNVFVCFEVFVLYLRDIRKLRKRKENPGITHIHLIHFHSFFGVTFIPVP
jgi:hypothetical protein